MIPFLKKNYLLKQLNDSLELLSPYKHSPRSLVQDYFKEQFNQKNFYLTKSCTQSLELAILTLKIPHGSEVILPSYGFVSLANAVASNGLKCIFVDCDPDTMNISTDAIQNAISPQTAALITINYGGVACDYDSIREICRTAQIYLIEDNAHGIYAQYKGAYLGRFGDISTISFDYMKNISCDEGGGISINREQLSSSFFQCYQFGTNKQDFIEGKVSSYEWMGIGTNSLLAEPLASILMTQLLQSEKIIHEYQLKWNRYKQQLLELEQKNQIEMAKIPDYAGHNAHMFWIKTRHSNERAQLMDYLFAKGIQTAFHYIPLHLSQFGKKSGEFRGVDQYTSRDSERLLRLPLYYSLTHTEQAFIIESIYEYYRKN